MAEDQEQVDKIVALRDQLPALRWVIYDDPRGMLHYRDERLLSYADVQKRGRAFFGRGPKSFERLFYPPRPYHKAVTP